MSSKDQEYKFVVGPVKECYGTSVGLRRLEGPDDGRQWMMWHENSSTGIIQESEV